MANKSPITITHLKLQWDIIYQTTERLPFQEPYRRIPQRFPSHIDEVEDGTDTDHFMEPDAEANPEQPSPTDVNPRSTKYDLCHNPKPNCKDYYIY